MAVKLDLVPIPSDLPQLAWVGKERKATYASYDVQVRLTDDRGEIRKAAVTAYGVDKEGPEILLGNPFLHKHDVQLDCGRQQWRWGLVDPARVQLITADQLEEQEGPFHFLGVLYNDPTSESGLARVQLACSLPEPSLPPELVKYKDVFDNKSARILPRNRASDHAIPVMEGKEPPYGPLYNLSQRELQVLREYIEDSLEKGWIRHSTSPAGSPILFVPKKRW